MTAVLLTAPRIRFLDSNGAPLVGGKIYTYLAGTTTPQATYTTAAGNVPNANPVILDSAGYADIWITGAYKIVVQDSSGNTISTTDNITAFTTGAVGATFLDGAFTLQNSSDPTKQLVWNLAAIGSGNTVSIGIPNSNFTMISPSIAQTYTAAQRLALVTLTDAATITPDFSLGNNYQLQLGGNRTIANPTNIVTGQSGNIAVYQDATGSRTVTWGWGWMAPSGGSLPTLQTAGGSVDALKYTVIAYNSATVTISIVSPGVVTLTNHGFELGQQVQIATTGALPTGLSIATTYYVVPINANSFSLATSLANAAAGTSINTTGSQSGVHTLTGLSISLTSALSTAVTDATIATTDTTTNNASTSKHGWLKKLSNIATQYMDGTGNWSTPTTGLTLGTATAFNSAATYAITALPTGITEININFQGVAFNATSNILFQIGDASGGLKTSGYLGAGTLTNAGATSASNFTTGFGIVGSTSASIQHGTLRLLLVDAANFIWSATGTFGLSNATLTAATGGSVALAAALDRITVTTVGGTAVWSVGKINISYR